MRAPPHARDAPRSFSDVSDRVLPVCGVTRLTQMLVVYLPWLQQVFQTEALSLGDLVFIVFVASSMVGLDTARKLLFPDRQGEASVSRASRPQAKAPRFVAHSKCRMWEDTCQMFLLASVIRSTCSRGAYTES